MDCANQKIFESFEIRPTISILRSCFPGDSQLPTTLLHRFPLRHKIECTKTFGIYIQLIVGAISQLRIQLDTVISCCGPTYWREAKQEASSKPLQRCRFVVEIADESQSNEYIHEAKEKMGKQHKLELLCRTGG